MKARIIPNPNTTEHKVKGAQTDGITLDMKELVVRITSDEHGKPLTRFTLHEEMTKPQLQKLLKVYEPAKN